MDDVLKANAQSARAYNKAVAESKRAARARNLTIMRKKLWGVDDQSALFAEVGQHVFYDEETGKFGWLHTDGPDKGLPLVSPTTGEPLYMGNADRYDLVSRSLVCSRKMDPNKKKRTHFSLARFAWWVHHGYDCGTPTAFANTGGCCIIDDTDMRVMAPENLILINDYIPQFHQMLIEQEKLAIAENCETTLATNRLVAMRNRLANKDFLGMEPVQRFINAGYDPFLFFHADPVNGVLYRRDAWAAYHSFYFSKRYTQCRGKTVKVERYVMPIPNVLWYMATGVFLGRARFRNGDDEDFRLANLCDKQSPQMQRRAIAKRMQKAMERGQY